MMTTVGAVINMFQCRQRQKIPSKTMLLSRQMVAMSLGSDVDKVDLSN